MLFSFASHQRYILDARRCATPTRSESPKVIEQTPQSSVSSPLLDRNKPDRNSSSRYSFDLRLHPFEMSEM